MKMNFNNELALYKMVTAIKKANQSFYDGVILFNQKVLTACGKIHAGLMQLEPIIADLFKAEHGEFFKGFAWSYYMSWRKTRAKSCAHLLEVYGMLNVKLGVQHFVGETFYAGIPVVMAEEINEAVQTCQVASDGVTPIDPKHPDFDHVKIGIDGKLHKTDKLGEFEPWSDPNDIYGDNTGVTLDEFNKLVAADASPCLTCTWSETCGSKDDVGCEAYEKIC